MLLSWPARVQLLFALSICAVACTEIPPPPEPLPTGFVRLSQWEIAQDALERIPSSGTDQPLQTPINIAISGGFDAAPEALVVAESRGWRLRRYPINTVEPLTLGVPEIILSVTPDIPGATTLPATLAHTQSIDSFGKLLVVLEDGSIVVSGPAGRLWMAAAGAEVAQMLGDDTTGLNPDDGVPVAQANLTQVTGLGYAFPNADEPGALLIATHNAVFAAPVTLTSTGPVVGDLERVVGSGAEGIPETGTVAREAELRLADTSTLLASEGSDLYMASTTDGYITMVPNWRQTDAPIVVIAGGGTRQAVTEDPLTLDLTLVPGTTLHVIAEADQRSIYFYLRGVPVTLEITLGNDGLLRTELSQITRVATEGFRDNAAALRTVGNTAILSNPEQGVLSAFTINDLEDPGRIVAGWSTEDDALNVLGWVQPIIAHPGALVPFTFRGSNQIAVGDIGSGWIWFEQQGSEILRPFVRSDRIGRVSENPFLEWPLVRPFQSLAVLPADRSQEGEPDRIVLSSQLAATAINAEFGENDESLIARFSASGESDVDPIHTAAFMSYLPSEAPILLGDNSEGELVLFDRENFALATRSPRDVGAVPFGPLTSLLRIGGGSNARILPTVEEPSGSKVTDLAYTTTATLTGEGVLTIVRDVPEQGGSVLGNSQLKLGPHCTTGGVPLVSAEIAFLAGGGEREAVDGALATEIAFSGLESAVGFCDGPLVLSLASEGSARLASVDEEGQFAWLSSEDRVDSDETTVAFDALQLASPTLLVKPPCVGDAQALWVGGNGAWWLNFSGEEADTLVGAIPSRSGRRIASGLVRDAACQGDTVVLLVDTENGPGLATVGGSRTAPLPIMSASSITVSEDEILAVGRSGEGAPYQIYRVLGDPAGGELGAEVLSGIREHPFNGRRVDAGQFVDDNPIYAGHEDGNLYCAIEGLLFRVLREPGEELTSNSRLDVVWIGEPFDEIAPTALAAEPLGASPNSSLLIASGSSLYRFVVGHGPTQRLIGIGSEKALPGTVARFARPTSIHAVVVDANGRVWLRWDDYVGFIDEEGYLRALAGGGTLSPRQTADPWELALSPTSVAHPSLAVTSWGEIFVAEPGLGLILSFEVF